VAPSFDELYALHADRVLALLFSLTRNEETARDLLQDVFLSVYRSLGSFQGRSAPGTWIHRIAVNHALNHLKRERRTLWFSVLDENIGALLRKERVELPGWHTGEAPRPDHALEAREQEELIERAIQGLPVTYRVPFLLYRDGEMGNAEIAETLGLSLSAVDARIHRAKKKLLAKLAPLLRGGA